MKKMDLFGSFKKKSQPITPVHEKAPPYSHDAHIYNINGDAEGAVRSMPTALVHGWDVKESHLYGYILEIHLNRLDGQIERTLLDICKQLGGDQVDVCAYNSAATRCIYRKPNTGREKVIDCDI